MPGIQNVLPACASVHAIHGRPTGKKQAPANVMAWIKHNEQDKMAKQKKQLSVGRNNPCSLRQREKI